jgi:hypothetical protein
MSDYDKMQVNRCPALGVTTVNRNETGEPMNAHEQAKAMMMQAPESLPPKVQTDDEIVEERAQAQFAKILEQKREHELAERITARIHELAQRAGLKPQSDDEVLRFMSEQKADNMKRQHIERLAEKKAEVIHSNWLAGTRKKSK